MRYDGVRLAWDKVLDAMGRIGAYTDVVFDDPAIHAAVMDLGGWPALCRTENKDLGRMERRFCQVHQNYTTRGEFAFVRVLEGEHAAPEAFQRRGLAPPAPTLVGDPQRARLVYQQGSQGTRLAGQAGQSLFTLVQQHLQRSKNQASR